MNIFVTDPSPIKSARVLPDKHIVKMPLETCQMLSIVASDKWGHGFGTLPKLDGTPYATEKGAFRNHPCTVWAQDNWTWLILHGLALCDEYTHRYNKVHSCQHTMKHAAEIFPYQNEYPKSYARAMPEIWKYDETIDTFEAYKTYIASKPWVATNYLRDPSRKPNWI
tara:strand:- start:1744 stop:2244 length:501 start_codon:yes stop_codon:yes gene_type:complete